MVDLEQPPSYDSIATELCNQLPADVKAWAQTKAFGTMIRTRPPSLMDEVMALRDSAIKIDQAFERVSRGLGQIDAKDYKDKNDKPIQKFQLTWVDYQTRWKALLWDSRDVATKTEAYIKDFLEVIVPQVEDIKTQDDLTDARLDLDAFIKRQDPKQLNSEETVNLAQKYSQDFTKLIRDLEQIQATFEKLFSQDHHVELELDITNKQAEIKILDQEIKNCENVASVISSAIPVTVALGYDATQAHLGLWVTVGVVIVNAIAVIWELQVLLRNDGKIKKKKELTCAAQRELKKLRVQLEDLKEIQAMLEKQKADVPDIRSRLNHFAVIWGHVRREATLINSDLNAAVGDQGSKKAFRMRINSTKDAYTNLRNALSLYATTIS